MSVLNSHSALNVTDNNERKLTFTLSISDWLSVCILRALFQNALSANPTFEIAIPMPCSETIFLKRVLHKYIHIYMNLFICEKLLSKNYNQTWLWHCKAFFGMALSAYWKRALQLCMSYIYIFICSHIYIVILYISKYIHVELYACLHIFINCLMYDVNILCIYVYIYLYVYIFIY